MPRPTEYTVHDVWWKMIRTFGEQTFARAHLFIHRAVMHSADEELGTIDNFSRNELKAGVKQL